MIYTLTMLLCLATGTCVLVAIEGTVPYAQTRDEACLTLAEPVARRPNVAAAWVTSCVVGQDT